jgi:GNAT superfamily N-acetyltransferase
MSTNSIDNVDYEIVPLECCSPAAKLYSGWIEKEWVREPICDWLESGSHLQTLGNVPMPIVYSAVSLGGNLLAAAAIVLDEMLDRRHWNPWLGLVYVAPEYRSCGIGSAVVTGLLQASDNAGIDDLYLFCPPELEQLYKRFNFKRIESREYDGVYAVTMKRHSEFKATEPAPPCGMPR